MSELDRAIDALDAYHRPADTSGTDGRLQRWLERARALAASDLLLVVVCSCGC